MEEEKRPLPGGVPSEGMLFDFELVSYRGPAYVLPRLVLKVLSLKKLIQSQ